MPIHDWTRVGDDTFHTLHYFWVAEICKALNGGTLPAGYSASPERRILGGLGPDVLTLERAWSGVPTPPNGAAPAGGGGVAVAAAPPRLRPISRHQPTSDGRRRISVRDSAERRLVAVIEIVSHGNKSSEDAARAFTGKALELFRHGIHLMVLDLHPPTTRDPLGLPNAIWHRLTGEPSALPADKPLSFASFDAGGGAVTAYAVPAAVSELLPDMPLFLLPGLCVEVPLEATYTAAFSAVPREESGPLERADPL